MKLVLPLLVLTFISSEDAYEQLVKEKADDQYCKDIIGNLTSILEQGYIFLEFLKSPIQPKGYSDYIPTVDLIKELNEINTTNRTFYEFYRDMQKILAKARDVI
jgi:hypothetical protein